MPFGWSYEHRGRSDIEVDCVAATVRISQSVHDIYIKQNLNQNVHVSKNKKHVHKTKSWSKCTCIPEIYFLFKY